MAEGLDLTAITRLVNSGRDQYNATREAIKMPTAGEQVSGGLVAATQDIPQNTFAGGLVKGLASGYDIAEKKKGATKRERLTEYLMEQEAYANKQQQYVEETAAKIQRLKLADEEARANGKVLADSLQSLELGDESGFRNFLAANQNVASLLGDDGPGGITPEGGRIVTRNGAKFVQAYGKGPNGEPWAGQEVPLDGILSRYAPDVLSARSTQALTAAQSQAELQKTQADTLKSLSDAGVSVPVAQGIIPGTMTGEPMPAPQATPQDAPQAVGTVASLVNSPTLTTRPKAKDDKAPSGYRYSADGVTLEPIPGGPADPSVKRVEPVSGEVAGKLSLVKQGQDAMARTKDILLKPTPNGKMVLNKGVVNEVAALSALQNIPLVGGAFPAGVSNEARELYTQLYNWNNAKLRLESGAAVPEQEVQRAVKAYMAGILDNAQTTQAKLAAPEKYFNDYLELMGRGNNPQASQATPQAAPQAGQPINQLPQGAQQIGTSGGKPVYRTPDGKMFVGQ